MAKKGQRWKSPRYKHKTAPRPRKLFKCRFYKRKRKWTAKAAARAVCAAIENGSNRRRIDIEIERQCGARRIDCDCERIALTLRQVLQLEEFVLISLSLLTGLSTVVSLVLLRRVPIIGPLLGRVLGNRVVQRITTQGEIIEGTFFRVREELFAIERQLTRELLPRP